MARSTFSTRVLVTTLLAWSFAALLVSGVILFIAPPGRVAHWTGWRLLGLTKSGWQGVHTLTAVLFLCGGLFHVLKFNWGPLKAYVRRSREAGGPFRWPLITGTLLFAVTVTGTIAGLPPFSSVMDLGEQATNAWATPDREPPVPHLELQTLRQVAASRGTPVELLQDILERHGLGRQDPATTLQEIASANGTTPEGIWTTLEKAAAARHVQGWGSSGPGIRGGGWGRLTVTEASARVGVDPRAAVERLRTAGVVTSPDEKLRDLASRLGWTPMELIQAIKGEG